MEISNNVSCCAPARQILVSIVQPLDERWQEGLNRIVQVVFVVPGCTIAVRGQIRYISVGLPQEIDRVFSSVVRNGTCPNDANTRFRPGNLIDGECHVYVLLILQHLVGPRVKGELSQEPRIGE